MATGTSAEQVADLNKSNSGSIEYLHLDFLDSASPTPRRPTVELKRIDALVTNAGVNRINPIWDMKTEDWDLPMEVNLKGVFPLTQRRLPDEGTGCRTHPEHRFDFWRGQQREAGRLFHH